MKLVISSIPNAYLIATTELENEGDRQARLEVDSVITVNNLNNYVRIVGFVDEMATLISSSDVCVFPFIHTKGPSDFFIAALEAMALSKPVIVSPVGGMPEIVDNSVGLSVNPFSISDLSQSIIDLLSNPAKCAQLGYRAKIRVQEMFDARKIQNSFNELYREILD